MKNLNRQFLLGLLLLSCSIDGMAQEVISPLHYRARIEKSSVYMSDSIDLHSSVLPLVNFNQKIHFEKTTGAIRFGKFPPFVPDFENNSHGYSGRIYPLADVGIGAEIQRNNPDPLRYNAGVGLGLDFRSKRFFFTGKLLPYITHSDFVSDSIQQNLSMDLGTTRPITGSVFQRSEILLAYQPHRIFTFLGGYGKNFFGEGYRSLLLSDNASNHPFLKIETAFGGIKYVNLYQVWNDNPFNPSDKSLDKTKFSAVHYLSWNITKEFNLSVFETVVWQAKDTLLNRGFDVNYLNPVVFYRPVEYNNGSADNVLLGLNMSFKLDDHCIYYQMILDEFLLAQIKSGNKWWGNKWGMQLGYKSDRFFTDNLYFQAEFNVVRPYTYSHKYSVQNYGHLNASVAHPAGANFYELLNIVSYKKENMRLTHKFTFLAYGADYDSVNYGQNIFLSYADRKDDFGNLIMQGQRNNVLNEQLIFEFPLIEELHLYATATYNYRMHWTPDAILHNHFFFIGIRSRLWNAYSDL